MMSRYTCAHPRRTEQTYKFHIGSHLSDLAHLHHDKLVNLRIALLVVPHVDVEGKNGGERESRETEKMASTSTRRTR